MTRRSSENGFSLVEVLVAVTILGLAMPVLYTSISGALNLERRQSERLDDSYLASALLDRVGLDLLLDEGVVEGVDSGRDWTLSIFPFSDGEVVDDKIPALFVVQAEVTPPAGVAGSPVQMRRLILLDRGQP